MNEASSRTLRCCSVVMPASFSSSALRLAARFASSACIHKDGSDAAAWILLIGVGAHRFLFLFGGFRELLGEGSIQFSSGLDEFAGNVLW